MTVSCELEYDWILVKLDGELFRKLHVSIVGKKPEIPFHAEEESLTSLIAKLETAGARQYALRKVAAQAVLSMQLRDSLKERGISTQIIQPIIDEFQRNGYINDEDWIASFVRVQKAKKAGPQMIFQKLRMKGVPEELIEPFMEEDSPQERLKTLIQTKYANRDLSQYKEKQKVVAALVRKGYALDDILNVL